MPIAVAVIVVAIRLSSATRYRQRPPVEYAILVKGNEHMWVSGRRIFQALGNSPILRIGLVVAAVVGAAGCDKLGLGGGSSPTAPTGRRSPGSTIVYTAVGASDADGVGSSVECLPLADCPNGMGYVPVTVRALTRAGFHGHEPEPAASRPAVIGRDFQALGQQIRPHDRRQLHRSGDAVRARELRPSSRSSPASTKSTRSRRRSAAAPRAPAIPTPTSTRR